MIDESLKFLTEENKEEFETGFGLQLINSIKLMLISFIVLEKNVLSCSLLGSWNQPLLSTYLPQASTHFLREFKFASQLFRYSKQPKLTGTLHCFILHWPELIKRNPFSMTEFPAGLGFNSETCLESTNRPVKQGLAKYKQIINIFNMIYLSFFNQLIISF